MKWTKDLPTEEGWYFWRFTNVGAGRIPLEHCVWVSRKANGLLFTGSWRGSQAQALKEEEHVLWAGPIPEPEEIQK